MDDVLVIGGGIIGTLVALECRRHGASVTVIDAAGQHPGASWAGGGILSPLFPWRYHDAWVPLTIDAAQRYRDWQQAITGAGLDSPELNACGMLVRAPADDGAAHWGQRHGVSVQPAAQSGLPANLVDSAHWWLPGVCAVRNPRWLAALRRLAEQRGVRWCEGTVTRVQDAAPAICEDGRSFDAGAVVVTAGYWSRHLLEQVAAARVIEPVKGEMLLYRLAPGDVPAILLADEGYLIPRRDGLVLAGSTVEPGKTDQRPSRGAYQSLRHLAARWHPPLAEQAPQAHWSGIRPGNTRDLPLIGPVSDSRRLWLASGHYRNGLVSAPASALLLAQLLAGQEPFCDPAPYLPSSSDSSSDSFCNR